MPLSLEQQARRRNGIGASEIAAVVGLSPYRRPIDVWQAKCEPRQVDEPSPATERGDFLEPALRSWYAYRFDREVALSDTLAHPEHDVVLATPDGISTPAGSPGDAVLLEIKSPGRHTQYDWGEPGTDEIPLYYLPQVTWAMAVTKLKVAHVVALVQSEMRTYTVPYDAELFAELLSKGLEFWRRNVLPRVPPPVDNSKAYADYLARRFRRVQQDSELAECRGGNRWASRLVSAQARIREATEQEQRAKNMLKEIMGEHDRLVCGNGHVTWRRRKDTETTDWQAVARDLGASDDLIAKHTYSKPGPRVFTAHLTALPDARKTSGAA